MATAFLLRPSASWHRSAFVGDEAVGRRAYYLGWAAVLCAMPCAVAILAMTGMTLGSSGMEVLLGTLVLLCMAHGWYRVCGGNGRLEAATGILAMMIMASLLAGVISNAGLRLRRPLIDSALLDADGRLGMDTPAIVARFSDHAVLMDILNAAYVSSLQLCIAAAIGLAVLGATARAWEVACAFAVCILAFSLITVGLPAIGLFPHTGVHLQLGDRLPEGAGVYHLQAFYALREGHERALQLREMTGVVTFPSFHVVTGAIVAWAGRGLHLVGVAAGGWGMLIAISALPIGGHYVVDLIAGLLFWVALICRMQWGRKRKYAAR